MNVTPTTQKQNTTTQLKMGKALEWVCLQRYTMGNKYILKCSASLVFRETQIKTKIRYHFTPTKMTIIFKKWNNKGW